MLNEHMQMYIYCIQYEHVVWGDVNCITTYASLCEFMWNQITISYSFIESLKFLHQICIKYFKLILKLKSKALIIFLYFEKKFIRKIYLRKYYSTISSKCTEPALYKVFIWIFLANALHITFISVYVVISGKWRKTNGW